MRYWLVILLLGCTLQASQSEPTQAELVQTVVSMQRLARELQTDLGATTELLSQAKSQNKQILLSLNTLTPLLKDTLDRLNVLHTEVVRVTKWGNEQAAAKDKALDQVDDLTLVNKRLTVENHKLKRIICGFCAAIVLLACLWLGLPKRIVVATHPVGLYLTITTPVLVFGTLWFVL